MEMKVDFRTACLHYANNEWVTIGSSPDNGWNCKKEYGAENLSYEVYRYKQYYDGEINFYINV